MKNRGGSSKRHAGRTLIVLELLVVTPAQRFCSVYADHVSQGSVRLGRVGVSWPRVGETDVSASRVCRCGDSSGEWGHYQRDSGSGCENGTPAIIRFSDALILLFSLKPSLFPFSEAFTLSFL